MDYNSVADNKGLSSFV